MRATLAMRPADRDAPLRRRTLSARSARIKVSSEGSAASRIDGAGLRHTIKGSGCRIQQDVGFGNQEEEEKRPLRATVGITPTAASRTTRESPDITVHAGFSDQEEEGMGDVKQRGVLVCNAQRLLCH